MRPQKRARLFIRADATPLPSRDFRRHGFDVLTNFQPLEHVGRHLLIRIHADCEGEPGFTSGFCSSSASLSFSMLARPARVGRAGSSPAATNLVASTGGSSLASCSSVKRVAPPSLTSTLKATLARHKSMPERHVRHRAPFGVQLEMTCSGLGALSRFVKYKPTASTGSTGVLHRCASWVTFALRGRAV